MAEWKRREVENERAAAQGSTDTRQRGLEMLLFMVVSAIGIYALGNGLTGMFEAGKGFNLLWLALAAAAMMFLFAQIGRVHDSWSRRRDRHTDQAQPATNEAVQQPAVQAKEREVR